MKKDSFTFSDKLKKSKTLPLSKRIPSRIGGEVKAKRTLFERAQRDLPFIIVAALALLLLPFLSRESGEIDTPSVVWGDGSDGYLEEFNQPKSAEGEIALSSFRNPLDLILRRGGEDSSAKDAIDTYGAGSESEESSGSYERSSYGSEYDSSAPATSTYGKTVRRSVRNSINRVPTSIGSLRTGSLVAPNGGSGIGHSMAFGSRARDGAARVQGPGVRPVALQPLTAAGKGRNLAGNDALYAEAARSIGAFNRPGAKQALLDAQLKDVDGKPLGDTQAAAAGAGDPYRPGAAGGLNNNWSHTPIKPWWWDMMQKRSQMRWELWHYNWEKMASDSLIKLTAGLASCLITGSNDFAVGAFLGKPGGEEDICCNVNGQEICASTVGQFAQTTSGSGKDREIRQDGIEGLKLFCPLDANGNLDRTKVYVTESGRKSALDVRLRCLGLKLSELKAKTEVKRSAMCNMYSDPMSIDIAIEKNGKEKVNKIKKMGYYVVSNKVVDDQVDIDKCTEITDGADKGKYNCECVTSIHRARYGRNLLPYQEDINKVVVFRVGTDITSSVANDDIYLAYEQKEDMDIAEEATSDEKKAIKKSDKEKDVKKLELKHVDEVENIFELAQFNIDKNAKYKGCYTEKDLYETLKPIGKWRTIRNAKSRLNEIAVCPAVKQLKSTFLPVDFAREESRDFEKPYMEDCRDHEIFVEGVPTLHKFSTTITDPGTRTIAFVLENVQQVTYGADGSFANGEGANWKVTRKIEYQNPGANDHLMTVNGNRTTFVGEATIGLSATANTDIATASTTTFELRPRALPGYGRIYWVTTNASAQEQPGVGEGGKVHGSEPNIDEIFNHPSRKVAICKYKWGCGQGNLCPAHNDDDSDKYCFVLKDEKLPDTEDNRIYYQAINYGGYMFITKPKTTVDPEDITRLDKVHRCDPVCKYLDENNNPIGLGLIGRDNTPLNKLPLDSRIDIDNCPICNEPEDDQLYCKHGDPAKAYPCQLISGEYIRTSQTPVEGVDPKNLPSCTPICAKKAEALGLFNPVSPDDIDEIKTTDDRLKLMPKAPVINALGGVSNLGDIPPDPLCPFCNPEDPGLVCVDPEYSQEPCPCIKVDNQSPAYINPLYIRSDVKTVNPQAEKIPVTPICYKKAIAQGNIYVRNLEDGTAGEQVQPDKDIVEMLLSKSKADQDRLCPVCNPENDDAEPSVRSTSRAINFDNASYDVYYRSNPDFQEIKSAVIDANVAYGNTTFTIIGYASPLNENDCSSCNDKLAYDRAIHFYNKMVEVLQDDYNISAPDIRTRVATSNYAQVSSDKFKKTISWPKSRIKIVTPKENSGKPTINFIIKSHAITADEAKKGIYPTVDSTVKISGSSREDTIDLQEDARFAVIVVGDAGI